jgi:predicted  nucleic acid-binding Zn-ribbon protein
MAEFEFGGMTFRGGKMVVVLTALSTAGGALLGGFEFYKDYMDMKEIIANIDIQEIRSSNELVITKLDEAIDYTRDIKSGLRDDIIKLESNIDRMEDKVDASEERVKNAQSAIETTLEGVRNEMNQVQKDVTASIREVESTVRESEKDVRDTMRTTEERIDENMRKLDKDLRETIQEALDNPLTQ